MFFTHIFVAVVVTCSLCSLSSLSSLSSHSCLSSLSSLSCLSSRSSLSCLSSLSSLSSLSLGEILSVEGLWAFPFHSPPALSRRGHYRGRRWRKIGCPNALPVSGLFVLVVGLNLLLLLPFRRSFFFVRGPSL